MEILRHPDHVEIKLPELFELDPPYENLARALTAVQPGTHNLLLDITARDQPYRQPGESEAIHLARKIADALGAMSDIPELLALLARPDQLASVRPYLHQLELLGYELRPFTNRSRAETWVGTD